MIEVVEKIDFSLPDIAEFNILTGWMGFVNGMVASHLLCHSGTINRHSLNGALLS
jgi:hypothetical protein